MGNVNIFYGTVRQVSQVVGSIPVERQIRNIDKNIKKLHTSIKETAM